MVYFVTSNMKNFHKLIANLSHNDKEVYTFEKINVSNFQAQQKEALAEEVSAKGRKGNQQNTCLADP